jgi:hypothetical protein
VTSVVIHQALFGYARGHRLLSSSVTFDPDSLRILRSVTDMAFEGKARSYLTVLPLPGVGSQAFVRTWQAADWLRVGSVWSHALIVDFATLGALKNPASIWSLFREPIAKDQVAFDAGVIDHYGVVIEAKELAASPPSSFDLAFAERALQGMYEEGGATTLVETHPDRLEHTLLAIYFQQWPRLRREFSMRTRARSVDSGWNFDLEVVERGDPQQSRAVPPTVSHLARDLTTPDSGLRRFLWRYGPEAPRPRRDALNLDAIYEEATSVDGSTSGVVDSLTNSFPKPQEMRLLKRDLFLPGSIRLPNWPDADAGRLRLAFDAAPCLDLSDLKVGERLADVALGSKSGQDLLGHVAIEMIPVDQLEKLVAELAAQASISQALTLAEANHEVGLLVASRRPELLGSEALWRHLDAELLDEVYAAADEKTQRSVLSSLVAGGAIEPLVLLCSHHGGGWWSLLEISVASRPKVGELAERASLLREVLARVGTASLGESPKTFNVEMTILTVLAADVAAGLWRRISPDELLAAVASPPGRKLAGEHKERLHAVALVAATASGQSTFRTQAWLQSFGFLHSALEREEFDSEAWHVLASTLPAGPDWDRCLRLRRGAVAEIERDHWSPAEIASVADKAHQYGDSLLRELEVERSRRARRGLFKDFLRLFSQ